MSDRRLNASIEVVPKQVLASGNLPSWFPAGTHVYIPDVGSDTLDEFVASAVKLRASGYEPVPHFPARRITSLDDFEQRLVRLTEEAEVRDILLIGGGLDKPAGDITCSMDVLESGLIDAYGITDVGVAGHPEGSPDFDEQTALEALQLKQDFANRSDAKLRIVTQFGFDPERFIQWSEGLQDYGVDLPVHLGTVGPAKMTTLVKYAVLCGVGPSLDFLKKRATALTTLVSGFDPDEMANPIEQHVFNNNNSAITQLHIFPFGGAKKASEWLQQRGSWVMNEPLESCATR